MDRDSLIDRIGVLNNIELDESVITSLKHPDSDVTVEKAIKRKGKRYGFYQSYRRIKDED